MDAQLAVVGRDEELAAIGVLLDSIVDGPVALVLEGEPGVGKTTLWRWGVDQAREANLCVLAAGPVEAERNLSLSTLGDLLAGILGDVLETLPGPQRRALEIALLLEEGDEHSTNPRTLGVALHNSLRALAESTPVLLAIDDVQWVDPASATVLGFALRRLRSARVGLLLAKRPNEPGQDPDPLQPNRLPREDAVSTIRIGPLSLGALHHLLNDRLGLVLARPKLRRLHEICAGNPFYGLELGRAFERGTIGLQPGESLPDTLGSLVGGRVGLLPAETRSALLAAAAASEPTRELVAQVVDGDVVAALRPALDADVIKIEDGLIRFSHPLLASGVYGAADAAERRALHRRLAALVPDPEERARHLARAAHGPNAEVAHALDDAAIRAHRRGAVAAAAELSELARQLTPEDREAEWHDRTIRAGLYAFEVGESGRARDLFEASLASAHPGSQRAHALYHLGSVEEYWGDRHRAVELYRKGLRESGADRACRAELEEGLASALFLMREQLPTAADHARVAVSLAEEDGAGRVLSQALATQGLIDAVLGRDGWRATLQRGIDLERDGEPAPIASGAPFHLAIVLTFVDQFDEARALLHSLLDRAYERVEESGLPWMLAQLAHVEFCAGNWDEAVARADEAIDFALQTSQEPQRLFALAVRALVRSTQGDVEHARADAEAVLEPAEKQGVMIATGHAAAALGLLDIVSGRLEDAHRLLGPLVLKLERGGVRELGSARFVTDEIEALVGLGRLEEAEALLERVEGLTKTSDRASVLAACLRARGLLAAKRGDLDGALESLGRALDQHDRCAIPFERGRTLLALGSTQRRARMKRAAREALQDACRVFGELGARPWAELAGAEIARIGGRGPATDELTPSERRVAALVAEGRSNKEVASDLVVTVKTVETHLSRIYAKLGLRSRTELAGRFAPEKIGERAGKQ